MVVLVQVMSWVVVTVVARIGIMCVWRIVAMCVGRVGQRCISAIAFPAGARAVLPVSAVLPVIATIHDSAQPTRLAAHSLPSSQPILAAARTATSPCSCAYFYVFTYSNRKKIFEMHNRLRLSFYIIQTLHHIKDFQDYSISLKMQFFNNLNHILRIIINK